MAKKKHVPDTTVDLLRPAPVIRKPAYSVLEFLEIHPISRRGFYGEVAAGRLVARKQGGRTIVLDTDYQNYLDALPRLDPAVLGGSGEGE